MKQCCVLENLCVYFGVIKLTVNEHNHFSDTNRNRPQHLVEINSLMNGTRRLMFAIEIKYLLV